MDVSRAQVVGRWSAAGTTPRVSSSGSVVLRLEHAVVMLVVFRMRAGEDR